LFEIRKLNILVSHDSSSTEPEIIKYNENIVSVLLATCFSHTEQEQLIALCLKTGETVSWDDLYCSFFDASSFEIINMILEKCLQDASKLSLHNKYGLTRTRQGGFSLLDVYLDRIKTVFDWASHDFKENLNLTRVEDKLRSYQLILLKMVRSGFFKLSELKLAMCFLDEDHCLALFNLLLFVSKVNVVEESRKDLEKMEMRMLDLSIKRMSDEESMRNALRFYVNVVYEKEKEFGGLEEASLACLKVLGDLKERFYYHVKMSPLWASLSESSRIEIGNKLVLSRNGGSGRYQPLRLDELCRSKVVAVLGHGNNIERNLEGEKVIFPSRIKRFLSYDNEIENHITYFFLICLIFK
jgi:hypothetical protein